MSNPSRLGFARLSAMRRRKKASLALTMLALALAWSLLTTFQSLAWDDDLLVESTLGQLALWMAEQSGNDPEDISSPLAQYAADWANELGAETLDPALLLNGEGGGPATSLTNRALPFPHYTPRPPHPRPPPMAPARLPP